MHVRLQSHCWFIYCMKSSTLLIKKLNCCSMPLLNLTFLFEIEYNLIVIIYRISHCLLKTQIIVLINLCFDQNQHFFGECYRSLFNEKNI